MDDQELKVQLPPAVIVVNLASQVTTVNLQNKLILLKFRRWFLELFKDETEKSIQVDF